MYDYSLQLSLICSTMSPDDSTLRPSPTFVFAMLWMQEAHAFHLVEASFVLGKSTYCIHTHTTADSPNSILQTATSQFPNANGIFTFLLGCTPSAGLSHNLPL